MVLLVSGCAGTEGAGSEDERGSADAAGHGDGAEIFRSQCAGCHGETGEGGVGPRLRDIAIPEVDLAAFIDTYMPPTRPESCDADCARAVARFIVTELTSQALACDEVAPSPRRLRLLTRREYRSTVFALFPTLAPAAGTDVPEADDAASCRVRRFEHRSAGRALRSVHVAGTFNDWSTTAWPLAFDATTDTWWAERELADGRHEYKLVLDGSEWVVDAGNPERAPDGFGGENSALTVSCESPPRPVGPERSALGDPAGSFPIETRPEGFPFDDDADSARVTAVHVDEQLAAATRIAEALGDGVSALVPCDGDEVSCAATFVRVFGRRVFRRPLTDIEIARYTALAATGDSRVERWSIVLRALLVSPHFLYRSEVGEAQPDGSARLTAFEVATALSYTLWGTTPDDALLDAAERGALEDDADVEREARRLLASPRSRGPIRDFALQWLGVESLATATKSPAQFPDFTADLRAAMLAETASLVEHVVFDGTGRFDEIFTADYTFASAALAGHYGLSAGGAADGTRPVPLADSGRAGVLGHGSVLGRYSHSDQTSPIQRGLFVRRNLLCQAFGQPPANAGGVPDVDASATTRERFRQHTENEACSSCHRYIDGVGFGFEGFDAVGRARDSENGLPIDSRGDMKDVEGLGTETSAPFSSLPELARTLAQSESASACFVRQWFRFARGYRETVEDRCAIARLETLFREHAGDVRELMVAVVLSPDFRRRQ
ncbi:MAG: DUF1592 domain-containing protein [Deltaproteobacteria bacterium]|nr:DUF1592 domain-containing protein [Deltaproteobacteria bacterium]